MIPNKKQKLSGWGNYPAVECVTYRPEKRNDLAQLYAAAGHSLIARGAGKSYGDNALNKDGVILSERLDHFLIFDEEKGVITAEAGTTLADILQVIVPKGWFLPVIPGTKYVSLGGAVAANVHGKNHFKEGEIARHIKEIKLRLAEGDVINCSPRKNAEIFWATVGGLGMTGFIEEVSLKLLPIKSANLEVKRVRVENIEQMVENFRQEEKSSDYMMGWIDHFASAKNIGKGVFEKACHIEKNDGSLRNYKLNHPKFNIPLFAPSFLLNKYSMALYNRYYLNGISNISGEVNSFNGFFHPLDSIGCWNKLYGKRGFLQYQLLVPEGRDAAANLRSILEMMQQSRLFSFLAVIKYHGAREGSMSFSDRGFSLALDFPNSKKVHALLDKVDEYLCGIGGRVYLAKDARMKRQNFEKMYADALPKWKKIIKQADPEGKINSAMADRLGFKKRM